MISALRCETPAVNACASRRAGERSAVSQDATKTQEAASARSGDVLLVCGDPLACSPRARNEPKLEGVGVKTCPRGDCVDVHPRLGLYPSVQPRQRVELAREPRPERSRWHRISGLPCSALIRGKTPTSTTAEASLVFANLETHRVVGSQAAAAAPLGVTLWYELGVTLVGTMWPQRRLPIA